MKIQRKLLTISNLAPVYCREASLIGRYFEQTTTQCFPSVSWKWSPYELLFRTFVHGGPFSHCRYGSSLPSGQIGRSGFQPIEQTDCQPFAKKGPKQLLFQDLCLHAIRTMWVKPIYYLNVSIVLQKIGKNGGSSMSVVLSVCKSRKVDCFSRDKCNGSPVACVQTSLHCCQANSPSSLISCISLQGKENEIFRLTICMPPTQCTPPFYLLV